MAPRGTPVGPSTALRAVLSGAGRLLSAREVALQLGVSTALVYRLVDAGRLTHVRVSNAIRVRREDLEAFLHHGGRS